MATKHDFNYVCFLNIVGVVAVCCTVGVSLRTRHDWVNLTEQMGSRVPCACVHDGFSRFRGAGFWFHRWDGSGGVWSCFLVMAMMDLKVTLSCTMRWPSVSSLYCVPPRCAILGCRSMASNCVGVLGNALRLPLRRRPCLRRDRVFIHSRHDQAGQVCVIGSAQSRGRCCIHSSGIIVYFVL